MRVVDEFDFDVMLEVKGKDLALLRLRSDLTLYSPDVAARFRTVVSNEEFPTDDLSIEEVD
jgi:hypothetical protein